MRRLIKKHIITLRPAAPWYNNTIRDEKQRRRKFERRWQASALTVHRELYVDQCNLVNKCIYDAKMDYHSTAINENHSDLRRLFSNFNTLFHRKAEDRLPQSYDNESLTNAFGDFFINKILNIREELQLEKNTVDDQFPEAPPYHGTTFCEFELVTTKELSELNRT